jgi:copper chaperone CopZ
MSTYIHDIPGRLRVKTPAIKGNDNAAAEVQRLLKIIEGIDSTAVNTTTGSVVINYNAKAVQSGKILDTLKESGYLDPSKVVTNEGRWRRQQSPHRLAPGENLRGLRPFLADRPDLIPAIRAGRHARVCVRRLLAASSGCQHEGRFSLPPSTFNPPRHSAKS